MKIEVSFTMPRTLRIPRVQVNGIVCIDKTFICNGDIRTFSVLKGNIQEVTVQIVSEGWIDDAGYHSCRTETCTSYEGLMVDFKVAETVPISNVEAVVICN